MAVTVKSITIWRQEVENQPGRLAQTLVPIVAAGADLQVLMGYRIPGHEGQAVIELFPITGKRMTAAARAAGLTPADTPSLLVQGDNKPGVALTIVDAVKEAGLNFSFLVANVIGRKYSAVMGFESAAAAKQAAAIIKKAGNPKKAPRRRAAR
jgi:hypothetical protein